MSPIQEFAVDALSWLGQTSLVAAILVVIAFVAQRLLGKYIGPRWTYTLWLLVALRLVLPFAPSSDFSLYNFYPSSSRSAPIPIDNIELKPVLIAPIIAQSNARPTSLPPALNVAGAAVMIWFAGAMIYFLICVIQYRRFAAWSRLQPCISDPKTLQALREAQQLLGYAGEIPLLATATLSVPALFGVVRPRLLVPQTMLDTWTPEELRHALLHELVHAKRRDHLLNWGLIFVQALHWFNPIAYFALKRLRAERELLCDAIALSRMNVEQRHSYGEVLIKAAQQFVRPRFSLAVVPMINQNNEVKRRVSMIVQFKPTRRVVSIAVIVVLALLACVTFTSRAQKAKPPPQSSTTPPVLTAEGEQQSINALRRAYDRLTQEVEVGTKRLETLRLELSIPSYLAAGDGNQPGPDTESIRRLEVLRSEAVGQFREIESLHNTLAGLSLAELRKAVMIATPDAQLGSLLERQADAVQRLAGLSETHAPEHPDMVSLKRTLETINRQVSERLVDIVAGLKVRVDHTKARLETYDQELEKLRHRDLEAPIRYREYFKLKRELENIQAVRDRLQMRILEEEINAGLSASSPPSIKPGAPAAKP